MINQHHSNNANMAATLAKTRDDLNESTKMK